MTRFFGLLIALLPLAMAACGDLPQPFAHSRTATSYPLAALTLDGRVTPVEGLPDAAGRGLAQAMAENLGGYGVTATDRDGAPSRFVLNGRASAEPPSGETIADLLITWTLNDAEGTQTGLHVQELRAAWTDWQPVDMGLMRAFAAAPAKAVAALVGVDADLPAGAAAEPAGDSLFVAGVVGAPGDGNTALAAAIARELAAAGLTVVTERTAAALILRGEVAVGPASGGEQPVALTWRVELPDGSPVGEAAQENAVPAGSLDGAWGPVAGYASAAAIEGIRAIIERRKAQGRQPAGIALPAEPVLPPPPGRAPAPEPDRAKPE